VHLAKPFDGARVVPLLYKLTFADVERPLGMFMAKPLDDLGVKETLETMNKHLDAERHMVQVALGGTFTALWPVFEKELARELRYTTPLANGSLVKYEKSLKRYSDMSRVLRSPLLFGVGW
jgi:hypothetical protein